MPTFDFSDNRNDHFVRCACGEDHEIVHKIYWDEVLFPKLICVNFAVCMNMKQTMFFDDQNNILSISNFAPASKAPYIKIENPFENQEKWITSFRLDDEIIVSDDIFLTEDKFSNTVRIFSRADLEDGQSPITVTKDELGSLKQAIDEILFGREELEDYDADQTP